MKVKIEYICDVPDSEISESLDALTGALSQLRQELQNNRNPCGYGIQLQFTYGEAALERQ